MASSRSGCESAWTGCRVSDAYLYAAAARSTVRFEIAARRIPTVELMIWFAMPRPMNPAPIIPTRIGRPSCSRARSALSRIIMALPGDGARHRHARGDERLALLEQRPYAVLVGHVGHRQRPLDREPRIGIPQPAFGRRRIE